MHSPRFLFACLLTSLTSFWGTPAIAQVIPDQTLGNESSIVTPNVEVNGNIADTIDGGAIRGSNLFHSFSEFSIGEGESLYFSSPVNIENIFSRVTGGNITTVEGLLGTTGASDAALILINPNGLVFGENASLDVQGSFTATTAAGVELGETGRFSATNPNSDNLLSIQPSAFFFENIGNRPTIQVSTQGRLDLFLNARVGGLSVPSEEQILLLGGDILVENATLNAWDGDITIGSVVGRGNIDFNARGIIFYNNLERGDIRIEDSSIVDVRLSGNGNISLTANNVDILSESHLLAGSRGLASSRENAPEEGKAGVLNIDATGTVNVSNSQLENSVGILSEGISGNIVVNAEKLLLENGFLLARLGGGAIGNSGDVTLNIDTLLLNSRSLVQTSNFGEADAGSIFISASDALVITDAAAIDAGTSGDGAGGSIIVQANNLRISEQGEINSGSSGNGRAGNIDIMTENISIQTRGEIAANTSGRGDGGSLSISTDRLRITGGGVISTRTDSTGDAGSLNINATESIDLSGTNPDASVRSNINAITNASGRGGNLSISVPYLSITNGAGIAVTTFGDGDAGSLKIENAELIELIGSANADTLSRLNAQAGENSTGQGGSIEVQSNNLRIADNALITARSLGTGTAGSITLNIADTLHLEDGGITTEASNSSGGDITIRNSDSESVSISGVVILDGNSDITTESLGNGGNITIQIPVVAFDDSDILARSENENGGKITLGALFSDIIPFDETEPFDGDGRVDVNADGALARGDITITDTVFIQNELAELSDNLVNIDSLLLSSCVVRGQENEGTISVSGSENLRAQPDSMATTYATGDVRAVGENLPEGVSWQQDGTVIEPQAVYSLPDGRLVMNRPCL
jgi:filamentous hemagglutinin family protein